MSEDNLTGMKSKPSHRSFVPSQPLGRKMRSALSCHSYISRAFRSKMGKLTKISLEAMIGSGNGGQVKVVSRLAKHQKNRDSYFKERRDKPFEVIFYIY